MWTLGLPAPLQTVFDRHAGGFPACAACVFSPGTVRYATAGVALTAGKPVAANAPVAVDEHTRFDLASLTKALATAPAVFALAEAGRLNLSDAPVHILPYARGPLRDHLAGVELTQLLNHSAGLPAYAPFFETCTTPLDLLESLGQLAPAGPPGLTFLYSDIGYIILGHHLSCTLGEDWTDWIRRTFYEPLGLAFSFWGVSPDAALAWNGVRARSEITSHSAAVPPDPPAGGHGSSPVHDENARILGSACGQAGLFGSLAQVTDWLQILRQFWCGALTGPLSNASMRRMWTPMRPEDAFTPGFDRPSRAGFTTAGDSVDRDATVGHLGFSGTAFWLHPPTGRGGVLLTNRVALGRHTAMDALRAFRVAFFSEVWKI